MHNSHAVVICANMKKMVELKVKVSSPRLQENKVKYKNVDYRERIIHKKFLSEKSPVPHTLDIERVSTGNNDTECPYM